MSICYLLEKSSLSKYEQGYIVVEASKKLGRHRTMQIEKGQVRDGNHICSKASAQEKSFNLE